MAHSVFQEGDCGHCGFGQLTEFAHTFTSGIQAIFLFIDDESIEKTTPAFNGYWIVGDDPTKNVIIFLVAEVVPRIFCKHHFNS